MVMNSYEFSGSTKFGECLDRLRSYWLIKKATVICLDTQVLLHLWTGLVSKFIVVFFPFLCLR